VNNSLIGVAARSIKNRQIPLTSTNKYNLPLFGSSGTNREGQMAAMGSVGTLFAIVNRTSNATSQVEWKLYRKQSDRRRIYGPYQPERKEVTSHLALDIFNKPNPYMTRQEFIEVIQQHLDLTGEAWWFLNKNKTSRWPEEIWPIRPDKMLPVPSAETFLSGYVYLSPDGQKVPLETDEIIFLRMPNPLDPYRGMGPVQSILTDIDSARYSAEWNRSFFLNSAEPGGIIEAPEGLGDDEFKRIKEQWAERHQGVHNAHRVAILEHAQWKPSGFTQKDMQFVELRNVSREVIREAFGFPKPLLGGVDDVNRANAEAGEVVFGRWLIVPRLERIKQALNTEFLPMFGATELEFDYENPVPEDKEADRAERDSLFNNALSLISAGFDPVDVMEKMGLPDFKFVEKQAGGGTDDALQPSNPESTDEDSVES
jgi:HK97 family phage portal protein